MITFSEFVNKVKSRHDNYSFEFRYGQTLMNTLYLVWPEKHKEITTLEYDCFYDDSKVDILLTKLAKEWPPLN